MIRPGPKIYNVVFLCSWSENWNGRQKADCRSWGGRKQSGKEGKMGETKDGAEGDGEKGAAEAREGLCCSEAAKTAEEEDE